MNVSCRDVASNVLIYFDLSVDDPLVNRPEFPGFDEIIKMQQSKITLRNIARRIRRIVRPRTERLTRV